MKRFSLFAAVLLLALLVVAGCVRESGGPVACTKEARVCPDGTAVGRVPPDCEFAPCPDASTKTPQPVCSEGETRDAVCPDGVTTYLAENCAGGEWHTVMYIRDPCSPVSGSGAGGSGINSFDECVAAGNPVMESYPRQCRADGKTFVEKI